MLIETSLALAILVQDHRLESFYVSTTRDATRIAVDTFVPESGGTDGTFPVLVEITRYWRGSEDPKTGLRQRGLGRLDRYLLQHGYALAKVDARGSGASFGTRAAEYGRQEVEDGRAVVTALVDRYWCDGNVGAYGTSYSGTTAEFLCAVGYPAVRAVIPGWSDFDIYESPARPYGLLASGFIGQWSTMVGWMDEGNVRMLGGQVARVDADVDGSLRDAALKAHAENPDVLRAVRDAEFRDDVIGGGRDTWFDCSSPGWRAQIQGHTPMLVLASWLDAGTAGGALLRYQHYTNPQNVVILASNHGGAQHASPFAAPGAAVAPSVQEQFELRRRFLDHHLKGDLDNGVGDWPGVQYFNMGEEAYHETESWPPPGVREVDYLLADERTLQVAGDTGSAGAPTDDGKNPDDDAPEADGADAPVGASRTSIPAALDHYRVDFGVSTGTANRWHTQMGSRISGLDDRGAMDERMLCYTTPPLAEDLQITGTPVVELCVASTHADGAFLAYLEVVDPDGRSRYVTEGGLRAIHRKLTPDVKMPQDVPTHSFARADAMPLVPGEPARIAFRLWPTSILVPKGHRVRLALAGADADTFDRVPAEGTPEWTVLLGGAQPSRLILPVDATEESER